MPDKDLEKIKKSKAKAEKAEAKRKAKIAKSEYKVQKNADKTETALEKEVAENLAQANNESDAKTIKKQTKKSIRVKKVKEEKEKTDYKLAFKEFPVKMVKEVNKIKWSGASNLTRKYITVLLFMAVFAVVFYFVDWGLQELFAAIKVV